MFKLRYFQRINIADLKEVVQTKAGENLELIPDSIVNEILEPKVIELFDVIGVRVVPSDIVACHRLPGSTEGNSNNLPNRTIVRFNNRKFCDKLKLNQKKLKNIDLRHIGLKSGKFLS